MRNLTPETDLDLESMIAVIAAPPAAPMAIVRQQLEGDDGKVLQNLLARLLGAFSAKAGQ